MNSWNALTIVCTFTICHRGFISATSGNRWWSSPFGHFGYSRPSWIYCNAWSIYAMRRRFYNLLFRHRPAQFPRGFRISKVDCTCSSHRRHPIGAHCKQTWSAITAEGSILFELDFAQEKQISARNKYIMHFLLRNVHRSVPMKASSWPPNLVVHFTKHQQHFATTSTMHSTHWSVKFDEKKIDG